MKFHPAWLVIVILGTLLVSWDRDLIPVHDGFGWDGQMYGMYTQYLPEAIEQGAINRYRMHRMLVPAGLYGILSALGVERSTWQVIEAYRWANSFFILLSFLFFLGIARTRKWRHATATLGIAALFFSVPLLKMSLFYPVLGDIPAFAFGLLAIWCWVNKWPFALLLSIFLGSFTGPTMLLYGVLLLLPSKEKRDFKKRSNLWLALLPVLFLAAWMAAWSIVPETFTDPEHKAQSVRLPFLPLSLLLVVGYLVLPGRILRQLPFPAVRHWIRQWPWWLGLVIAVAVIQVIIHRLAGDAEAPQSMTQYGLNILQQATTYPAGFLVAHFQYMPGLIILVALTARGWGKQTSALGAGPAVLTIIVLLLALGSETRQLLQLIPWLVFIALEVWDGKGRIHPVLLGVVVAACWMAARWWQDLAGPGDLDGDFLTFPAQTYFQLHGPWMNLDSYQQALFYMLGTLLILAVSIWRRWLVPPHWSTNPKT